MLKFFLSKKEHFWPGTIQGLTLLLRPECHGTIIVHCSLNLLGSSNPPISTSLVTGTTNGKKIHRKHM
ncbi:Protein PPP5D1 [Plecturocebus cupreus]